MKILRTISLLILSVWCRGLGAGEPALDPRLDNPLQIAEMGRLELALRIVNQHLKNYPEDPRLIALRTQLVATLAKSRDEPSHLPPPVDPPPFAATHQPETGHSYTIRAVDLPMIWIPPGSFWMCNPQGGDDDTKVTLTRGYWLGRTEVTQEQWQAVMVNLPSPSHFKGSDRPVENIAWNSAMEFCKKLTDIELAAGRLPPGYAYTLPTEAQWEYACRAGTTGPLAGEIDSMAWHDGNSGGQTHPVAQKQPNAWGFYDMHGNVVEWCRDGYSNYPGGHAFDPMNGYDGPAAAMYRMARGGGYAATVGQCRSAYRYRYLMVYTFYAVGFRIALTPIQDTPATKAPGAL